ncbi:MAG: DUF308 domain-containing protein [Patescibacteria group bacterium]|nr:DUF308 domain-containing protein [Patescibacteria group bacterium]
MNTKILAKYRGMILGRGILAIILGLFVMFFVKTTLAFLVVAIGVFALLDGIFLIAGAFSAKEHKKWGVFLAEGIISLIFGVMVFAWPAITVTILLYLVATWAVITGVIEMMVGFSEEEGVIGKWLLVTTGVLSLVIGILMFFFPLKTLEIVMWLVGLYAFIIGLALTIFSFQLKNN